MEFYIVTTNFSITKNNSSEESVLHTPYIKRTYREARRLVQKFTKRWDKTPVLFRKVVPADVIKKISLEYEEFSPICIATFVGKHQDYEKIGVVWFAIYKVKIKS